MKKDEIIAYIKERELDNWNMLKCYEDFFGVDSNQSQNQLIAWIELYRLCYDLGIEVEMEGRK